MSDRAVYQLILPCAHLRQALALRASPFGRTRLRRRQGRVPFRSASSIALSLCSPVPSVLTNRSPPFALTLSPVGSGAEKSTDESKIEELKTLLGRVSKIKLIVLDAVISHLRTLIDSTKSDEADEVFISKLGFSLGRGRSTPSDFFSVFAQD